MKLQVKVTFVVLFLGILWIFGLFAPIDVFADNKISFQVTFTNNGDAQSWVDFNIFEDRTSPFGQYNSGDLVFYYSGQSPALGFGEWVSVPAYSSVQVSRGPYLNYEPTGSPVYVAYLPWKYEDPDPRDDGCEDPIASLTPKEITTHSISGINYVHAVVSTSQQYSCFIPQPPPPPSNQQPEGYLDAADCDSFRGWARDPDNLGTSIGVHFYRDGTPGGGGVIVGSTTANIPREPAVGNH